MFLNQPTASGIERLKDFAGRLMLMKHEACELGLYKTMQLMEEPIRAVGYEIEGKMTITDQTCADCGKLGRCPFVDSDRENAPICADCYRCWREREG